MKGLTIEKTGAMIQSKMQDDGATIDELMKPIIKGLQASGFMGETEDDEDDEEDNEDDSKN